MKKNLTEMVFVLDRSGSMGNLSDDTIGGFNSLIAKQKEEPGGAFVTTVLFDDEYEVIHDHVALSEINELTDKEYFARGTTALLDAVGKTINSIGTRLNNTSEDEKPEKVVFVIVTDGHENASKEFEKSAIKEMIQHQQAKYSWIFMFLGANIDAVSEGSSLGISSTHTHTYSATNMGTQSVYLSTATALQGIRAANTVTQANAVVADALNLVE